MRDSIQKKARFILTAALLFIPILVSGAMGATPSGLTLSILCDDTATSTAFSTEHGVSIFLELPNGHQWLMDTGTTDIYQKNAETMGISLDHLSGIAISHGHDDHTGGLSFYPRMAGAPPVYGHPYIWHKQFGIKKNAPVRICGMPYLARKYAQAAFKPVNGITQLDEGLYFFTDIPRETGSYQPIQGKFFNEDGTGPCPMIDDATLVAQTPQGLVVIFGCAHAGYINILKTIMKKFPSEKILSVVGGLHLKSASPKVLERAIAYTNRVKADDFTFYGGHCTGTTAISYFQKIYGPQAVNPLGAGTVIHY